MDAYRRALEPESVRMALPQCGAWMRPDSGGARSMDPWGSRMLMWSPSPTTPIRWAETHTFTC